jgi:hypothetical protein
MKETLDSFLELLEETVLMNQEEEPTKDFINGVKETVEYARVWFEANNITEFDVLDIG